MITAISYMSKPWACLLLALLFYITGMTTCILTDNPWFAFFFLGTFRFLLEVFKD